MSATGWARKTAALWIAALAVCVLGCQTATAKPLSIDENLPLFSASYHLIGKIRQHRIRPRETLLDIARQYDLGFNEIQELYPKMDLWLPPSGTVMHIPSKWILPHGEGGQIVVNIAELRLYYFSPTGKQVSTFPVGIGEKTQPTPEGSFVVTGKIRHPTWFVPPSLRHKYTFTSLPPGPDNPLGAFWLGLDHDHIGIHGTDFPWSIGWAMTHGCIRLYPEDIKRLFRIIQPGTTVKIIYAPVKIGTQNHRVFVEVHRDVYNRIDNFEQYGFDLLQEKQMTQRVDLEKFRRALERQNGIPVDVTAQKEEEP
jgi:L,D-transpeptidase ErfK/SrfK